MQKVGYFSLDTNLYFRGYIYIFPLYPVQINSLYPKTVNYDPAYSIFTEDQSVVATTFYVTICALKSLMVFSSCAYVPSKHLSGNYITISHVSNLATLFFRD